ncbi:hypothetical protein EDB84DRAFT_1553164 [Lactarius hengduanensis]|nr:hypothetical protein EDB84DRAFT_1553164 [Lactarius hengduanensis]
MPLGLTFSFPVEQMVPDKYEKFISGMYHDLGEITRDTLLALVDAAPQPIPFGSKAPEQALRARHGGAQPRRDGQRRRTTPAAALVEDPEKLVPATLRCLKRQEIVQEHFGYEPCEVSLRDAALVVRRSARPERVSRRDRRALDGLRQRAREGRAASSVVDVGGKLYAIGLDWR